MFLNVLFYAFWPNFESNFGVLFSSIFGQVQGSFWRSFLLEKRLFNAYLHSLVLFTTFYWFFPVFLDPPSTT